MLRAFDHICMEKARYKFLIIIIIIIIIITITIIIIIIIIIILSLWQSVFDISIIIEYWFGFSFPFFYHLW